MSKTLHIQIVGNNQQLLCQSGCNNDWSQPNEQTKARMHLQERFGDHIKLDYLDMKDIDMHYKKEKQFPLLVVDGHVRLSGQFDMRQLVEIIEAQLELEIADR
jgi:hypothetical protein